MSFIAQEDFGQIWRAANNLTVDPFKNILYYFCPLAGAFVAGHTAINLTDPSLQTFYSKEKINDMLDEIDRIKKAANLSRSINLYTSMTFRPSSCGGELSITAPFILLPTWLLNPTSRNFDQKEVADKPFHYQFTKDEARFFIAREVRNVKRNVSLFKTIAKITLLAAAFFLHTTVIGWVGAIAIIAVAISLYVLADRYYEGLTDLKAVNILSQTKDPTGCLIGKTRALNAAISALEKLQTQNLERRESNFLAKLYITKKGNNFLDYEQPFLTKRIRTLVQERDGQTTPFTSETASLAPC